MKKQIIILAAAVMPFAFISCSKENINTQQARSVTTDPAATLQTGTAPIIKKSTLSALFQFNGNLKDKTGHLADAVPSIAGAAVYTTDRKGVSNSAIQFVGSYGLDIFKVPSEPNSSVAAWVKTAPSTAPADFMFFLYSGSGPNPNFGYGFSNYYGAISTPATTSVSSGVMDYNWHHLVATYDGTDLRFYVDGKYIGKSNNPSNYKSSTITYNVGYMPASAVYWAGCMDDLSFYSRTLSDADVLQLYNL
jgi:hypothetical protein